MHGCCFFFFKCCYLCVFSYLFLLLRFICHFLFLVLFVVYTWLFFFFFCFFFLLFIICARLRATFGFTVLSLILLRQNVWITYSKPSREKRTFFLIVIYTLIVIQFEKKFKKNLYIYSPLFLQACFNFYSFFSSSPFTHHQFPISITFYLTHHA